VAHLPSVAFVKGWKVRTDFRVIKYVLHQLPLSPVREAKRPFLACIAMTLSGHFVGLMAR